MRQQAGHAQSGVGWQHAQHRFHGCLEPILPVQFDEQLTGRFVAEGIADDDKHFTVRALVQHGQDFLTVEILLVEHFREPPLGEHAILYPVTPGKGERCEESIAVMQFDLIPQRLEHAPCLCFGRIGMLAELTVKLIELVKLPGVGVPEVGSGGGTETVGIGAA